MNPVIRPAVPADRDVMLLLWERSVRATHDFITEEEIVELRAMVRGYLASTGTAFHVMEDRCQVLGFMGLGDDEIESLFIEPHCRGRGLGTRLVEFARAGRDVLRLDVNEENPAATGFYLSLGFRIEGRSELDGQGNPHPLLHMVWLRPRP